MIGYAFTASYCTISKSISIMQKLIEKGYDILPIMSENASTKDTRFGNASTIVKNITEICGREVIHTIVDAEPLGPKINLEALVICPCTGNTLAKIANGITDSTITMTAKIFFRNRKAVLIALATNDALGMTLRNIGTLAVRKNVYFVPLAQDDCVKKPDSLVCDFKKLALSAENAIKGLQTQPCIE